MNSFIHISGKWIQCVSISSTYRVVSVINCDVILVQTRNEVASDSPISNLLVSSNPLFLIKRKVNNQSSTPTTNVPCVTPRGNTWCWQQMVNWGHSRSTTSVPTELQMLTGDLRSMRCYSLVVLTSNDALVDCQCTTSTLDTRY